MMPPQQTVIPACAHARQRGKPVGVGTRRDDAAVELRRRVEVVVVRGQPCGAERGGLLVGQHAERAARLHAEAADHADHLQHPFEGRALGGVAPRRAHAEARRALRPGADRRLAHLVERDEILARDAGRVVRRLRTIRAIFRTAAGLDAEQHAALDLIGAVIRALHLLRAEDEIGERRGIDRLDLVERPVVSNRCGHRFLSLTEQALEPKGSYPVVQRRPRRARRRNATTTIAQDENHPAQPVRRADRGDARHVKGAQREQHDRQDIDEKAGGGSRLAGRRRLELRLRRRGSAPVADDRLVGDLCSTLTTLHRIWSSGHLVIWSLIGSLDDSIGQSMTEITR